MTIVIRPERPADQGEIHDITKRAFAPMEYADGDEQDLIDAIQKGLTILDRTMQRQSEAAETIALLSLLTERETEVLEMVARGITSAQIAGILSLSPRTVESHRAAIGHKLGTTSAAEQARLWQEGNATT